ncbi:uncharacterized protein LOC141695976 [Apium graveolens]|uniref:uncharacterized protein LOC141695976 n=1 Tax=Apium graveolens TaxID=4045 RepID=UPI003D7AD792
MDEDQIVEQAHNGPTKNNIDDLDDPEAREALVADRVTLWNDLNSLSTTAMHWCVLGEFNSILNIDEVRGGRAHWTPDMQAFKDCLIAASLCQIRTVGELFTWTNKRPLSPILKYLDRAVVNGVWLPTYTESQAFVKNRGVMDHNPLILNIATDIETFGKAFQFFNHMLELPEFPDIIAKVWGQPLYGGPMSILCRKLKLVRLALGDLNRKHGNLHSNVNKARAELSNIQDMMVNDSSLDLLMEEKVLIEHLNEALLQEDKLLMQKSRV